MCYASSQWLPEIARYAPGKPIILVGTKVRFRIEKVVLTH
jgi:hypothetical protein